MRLPAERASHGAASREEHRGSSARHPSRLKAGISPAEVRVVIYALENTRHVQPWDARPHITVKDAGKWPSPTHATFEFAGLLVKPNFRPKATLAEPPKVGGDDLAMARKKPGE